MNPEVLLGLNAAVEDNLDRRPSHHDHEEEHDHDETIDSICITVDRAFDPKTLIDRLSAFVREREIYRIKGFVWVPNKPMRLVLQGVGQRFDSFFDRPWTTEETRQTQLVFIGQSLNRSELEEILSTTNN